MNETLFPETWEVDSGYCRQKYTYLQYQVDVRELGSQFNNVSFNKVEETVLVADVKSNNFLDTFGLQIKDEFWERALTEFSPIDGKWSKKQYKKVMKKVLDFEKYDCMVVNGSIPNEYFPGKNCSQLMALPRNGNDINTIYKADEIEYQSSAVSY
jgi:hypothetical protein